MRHPFSKTRLGRHAPGLTLIELMIVAAIGSFIAMSMNALLKSLRQGQQRAEDLLLADSAESVGQKQLWFDVRRSGISFNFIELPADEDPLVRFYDYLPDIGCSETATRKCTRTFTLSKDGPPERAMVFALSQGQLPPATPISPLSFYDSKPAPTISTAGSLSFNESRFLDTLKNIKPGHDFLREGTLLRFYTPISMRPTTDNPYIPPRFVSLVGIVKNGRVEVPKFDWQPYQRHPAFATELDTNDGGFSPLDKFFRIMPPVGGRSSFGMVMPIEVVRYRIEPIEYQRRASGQLVREVFGASGWTRKFVVAIGVDKVTFSRSSVSTPSVSLALAMDRSR